MRWFLRSGPAAKRRASQAKLMVESLDERVVPATVAAGSMGAVARRAALIANRGNTGGAGRAGLLAAQQARLASQSALRTARAGVNGAAARSRLGNAAGNRLGAGNGSNLANGTTRLTTNPFGTAGLTTTPAPGDIVVGSNLAAGLLTSALNTGTLAGTTGTLGSSLGGVLGTGGVFVSGNTGVIGTSTLNTLNGLVTTNGLNTINGQTTLNGLSSLNTSLAALNTSLGTAGFPTGGVTLNGLSTSGTTVLNSGVASTLGSVSQNFVPDFGLVTPASPGTGGGTSGTTTGVPVNAGTANPGLGLGFFGAPSVTGLTGANTFGVASPTGVAVI